MLKKALFILCSCLLLACTDAEKVTVPDTVLQKEQMAKVMVDIHLLEATMNLNVAEADNSHPTSLDIFSKHSTTKEQYDESYLFYTQHPEILAEIYQLVLNDLSKMQAETLNAK